MVRLAGVTAFQWALMGLAVSFQVLGTVVVAGNPLRIGVADLLLPGLVLAAAWQWLAAGRPVPHCRMPRLWAWIAALTLWLAVGLVVGRLYTGEFQKWALVNKFLGWGVLLCFLVVGAWVAGRAGDRDRRLFVDALLLFAAVVGAMELVNFSTGQFGGTNTYPRAEGLAANPNSFGYLHAVILCVGLADPVRGRARAANSWVLGIILAAVVISGSRSAFVGLALGIAALAALGRLPVRTLVLTGAVAAFLVGTAHGIPALFKLLLPVISESGELPLLPAEGGAVLGDWLVTRPYYLRDNIADDGGVSHRLRITMHALDLWRDHPWFGVGLGGFYWADMKAFGTGAAVIHNTALWLLTELGVVGFGLFGAFFLVGMKRLWDTRKDMDPLSAGAFAALAVFLGASVGMEAMYQRHLWFLAGYALFLPRSGPCRD